MGENTTQQPKIYSFFPPEKSPLMDLHLSLSKVSFLPHQIAIFMLSPFASFISTCTHFCCIVFLTWGSMYTHVILILLTQCSLNVAFSMTKALNGQSTLKQKFPFPPPFNAIWKKLLLLMLVFLFLTLPFLFQTLWNFNWPTPVGISWLVS